MSEPDLLSATLQACVGPAAGIELYAFIQHLDQLPDIDAILRGEEVPLPKAIDMQYAVASALVSRGVRAKGDPQAKLIYGRVIDYAARFAQREMGVMIVHDLARTVGRDVYAVPEFNRWAKDIAAVLL